MSINQFLLFHLFSTITGYWERSTDGSSWERDFDLFCYRVMPVTNVKVTIK
jgi:hypothetical protein